VLDAWVSRAITVGTVAAMIGVKATKEGSAMKESTVRADGLELFVAEAGQGTPVVLLHGGILDVSLASLTGRAPSPPLPDGD
jgi:actin-like ATPase involved in cell morphogenesis